MDSEIQQSASKEKSTKIPLLSAGPLPSYIEETSIAFGAILVVRLYQVSDQTLTKNSGPILTKATLMNLV